MEWAIRNWDRLLALAAALSICTVSVILPLTSYSSPPASSVGYGEHISGIQLGDNVCISLAPAIAESGYMLFAYDGQLDGSWVIRLETNGQDVYVPTSGAFTQSVLGEEIEVYNIKLDSIGLLSCDWKRIK